jgi:hypothetical protein
MSVWVVGQGLRVLQREHQGGGLETEGMARGTMEGVSMAGSKMQGGQLQGGHDIYNDGKTPTTWTW